MKTVIHLIIWTLSYSQISNAQIVSECIETNNPYGYSVSFGGNKVNIDYLATLWHGKYGRAVTSAQYELVQTSYNAGGHIELYQKISEDEIGSHSMPSRFKIKYFTRIADNPTYTLILDSGYSSGLSCSYLPKCKFSRNPKCDPF